MPTSAVTVDAVRSTLHALRYDQTLDDTGLLDLDLASEVLRESELPDTRESRRVAVSQLLEDVIDEKLERLRPDAGLPPGTAGRGPNASSQDEPARSSKEARSRLRELGEDFQRGDPTLEAWSALAARYLSPQHWSMDALAEKAGVSKRTLRRRLMHGYDLLTDALKRRERRVHPTLTAGVPHPTTSFVGRERELAEAAGLLKSFRCVTLTGPGGIGKSRLAIELAHRWPEPAACYVDLARADPKRPVAAVVAQAMAITEPPDRDWAGAVIGAIGPRTMLLLLDNCEHLARDCGQLVRRLLRSCPGLTVLAASRRPMQLPGEVVWPVPPMTLPRPNETGEGPPSADAQDLNTQQAAEAQNAVVDHSDAMELFRARARASRAGRDVTEEELAAAARICRYLEGIPLSLEIAASRMGVMTAIQLEQRLIDRLSIGLPGGYGERPSHTSVRAALDWSHRLLTDDQSSMFATLAAFEGGWTVDAAAEVHGADLSTTETLLRDLADHSLVQVLPPGPGPSAAEFGPRMYLLDTVHEYAGTRLRQHDQPGVYERHVAHYRRLVERAAPALWTPEQVVWLRRLDLEYANISVAMERALGGERRAALEMAAGLTWYWMRRGLWLEGIRWLDQALAVHTPGLGSGSGHTPLDAPDAPHAPGPEVSPELRLAVGEALLGGAILRGNLGRMAAALAHNRAALEWLGSADEFPGPYAHALAHEGRLLFMQGDGEGAARRMRSAEALARKTGDLDILGLICFLRGFVLEMSRKASESAEAYAASVELHRESGHLHGLAHSLRGLATASRIAGDLSRAMALAEESLSLFREMGDLHGIGHAALERHLGLTALEKTQGARAALREAIEMQLLVADVFISLQVLDAVSQEVKRGGNEQGAEQLRSVAIGLSVKVNVRGPQAEQSPAQPTTPPDKTVEESDRPVPDVRRALRLASQLVADL